MALGPQRQGEGRRLGVGDAGQIFRMAWRIPGVDRLVRNVSRIAQSAQSATQRMRRGRNHQWIAMAILSRS
jgi:hypothetical protein